MQRQGKRGRRRGGVRVRAAREGRAGQVYKARQPGYGGMVDAVASATGVKRGLITFNDDGTMREQERAPRVRLSIGAWSLPHPEKVKRGGEDAHFVGRECAGVADGVGGWIEQGVDPGIYSRELMRGAADALASTPDGGDDKAVDALRQAHMRANDAATGSTTACIAYLDTSLESVLRVANVGDSALLLFRSGVLAFRTQAQQHAFNYPFQLGSEGSDTADDADIFRVNVYDGDCLVLGTDGITDNLFEEDIAEIAWKGVTSGKSPSQVARALADAARAASFDETSLSPFAASARDYGLVFDGGKVDDITVVVCYVLST